MNIAKVKFQMPVLIKGKSVQSINLMATKQGREPEHKLSFEGGLLTIETKEYGIKTYVGMTNIVYMSEMMEKKKAATKK